MEKHPHGRDIHTCNGNTSGTVAYYWKTRWREEDTKEGKSHQACQDSPRENHPDRNGTTPRVLFRLTPSVRGLGKRVDLDQGAVSLDEHLVHVLEEGLAL